MNEPPDEARRDEARRGDSGLGNRLVFLAIIGSPPPRHAINNNATLLIEVSWYEKNRRRGEDDATRGARIASETFLSRVVYALAYTCAEFIFP